MYKTLEFKDTKNNGGGDLLATTEYGSYRLVYLKGVWQFFFNDLNQGVSDSRVAKVERCANEHYNNKLSETVKDKEENKQLVFIDDINGDLCATTELGSYRIRHQDGGHILSFNRRYVTNSTELKDLLLYASIHYENELKIKETFEVIIKKEGPLDFKESSVGQWARDNKIAEDKEIESPDHYTKGNIEVFDFIEDQGIGLACAIGNVIKYVCRAPHKHFKKDGGVGDLRKAREYIDKAIRIAAKEHAERKAVDPILEQEALKVNLQLGLIDIKNEEKELAKEKPEFIPIVNEESIEEYIVKNGVKVKVEKMTAKEKEGK